MKTPVICRECIHVMICQNDGVMVDDGGFCAFRKGKCRECLHYDPFYTEAYGQCIAHINAMVGSNEFCALWRSKNEKSK